MSLVSKLELAPMPYRDELKRRAQAVIPGGMYGHTDDKILWPGAPQFVDRAQGARFWDVDGNEYIDFMCSWGPIIHGHRHPVVEEAYNNQLAKVDTANGPGEVMIELAELMTESVAHASWALFAKNGSDATTLCLTLARAHTGRKMILVAEGAYHGALPWCNPNMNGSVPGDRANLAYFKFNDLDSVIELAKKHQGDLAGIIVSAFRHDAGHDQEMATEEFAKGLRELCDKENALLILDDVRAGFRLTFGSSWETLGVNPDLSAWSKAIGNGYPIGAVLGSEFLKNTPSKVYATGSFWQSAAPMAAAVATIKLLRDTDGVNQMHARGLQLREGLAAQAEHYGLKINITGPSTMLYLSFVDEKEREKTEFWAAACAKYGVFVHPRHNWFISTAHTEEDIKQALVATDKAFADVARHLGI